MSVRSIYDSRTDVYVYVCVHVYAHKYVRVCACACACAIVFVCMNARIDMHVYVDMVHMKTSLV